MFVLFYFYFSFIAVVRSALLDTNTLHRVDSKQAVAATQLLTYIRTFVIHHWHWFSSVRVWRLLVCRAYEILA